MLPLLVRAVTLAGGATMCRRKLGSPIRATWISPAAVLISFWYSPFGPLFWVRRAPKPMGFAHRHVLEEPVRPARPGAGQAIAGQRQHPAHDVILRIPIPQPTAEEQAEDELRCPGCTRSVVSTLL